MLQAASHPPLLAHRVSRLLVHEQLLQSGDDPRILYFCQLTTGTWQADAIVPAWARRPRAGFSVGARIGGGWVQDLQFVKAGCNRLARQPGGGTDTRDPSPSHRPGFGSSPQATESLIQGRAERLELALDGCEV